MVPRTRPSRADLAAAVGGVLFLKLSLPDVDRVFKAVGAAADWATVAHFTRQALRSPSAAVTLSAHFVQCLAVIDAALEPQMYLGCDRPCVADLACHVALAAAFAAFDDKHKWTLCNASRWFDTVQHAAVELAPPAELKCELVSFEYDAPTPLPSLASLRPLVEAAGATVVLVADAPKAEAPVLYAPAPPHDAAAGEEEKGGAKKKEKKEKVKKEKPPPVAAGADQSNVSKLDIRVGLILEAKQHPEADKLYVESVDVGEDAPRTVVSGLAGLVELDALQGRRAVLLCNLKPANMRGVQSQAMVLCASDEAEPKTVELLAPPNGAKVGERVVFDGHPGEPLAPSAIAKKKVFEAVAPLLQTSAERVATYDSVPFMTSAGPVTVSTLAGAKIK